jgi:hypothetical protein
MRDSPARYARRYHREGMSPTGRNLGLAAIAFFSAKGLAWLILPFLLYAWGC